jgi:transcriptional regulator with XRE-family HTH domain
MPRPKPDPEVVAEAVRHVRAGATLEAVAKAVGVTGATISRWVSASKAPPATAVPPDVQARAAALVKKADAPPPPPAAPVEDECADDAPALEQVRALIRRMNRAAREAERDPAGPNWAVVNRSLAALTRIMPTLKQLEKIEQESEDRITIPRAELERAEAEIEARILTLTGGPVRCGDCRKKLLG